MKKVIFAVMLMLGMGSANAAPVLFGPALVAFGSAGLGYTAGKNSEVPACYNEPAQLVKWKGQPGYSFTLAGCDLVAKQDQIVAVK